jgi:hypothetical protein
MMQFAVGEGFLLSRFFNWVIMSRGKVPEIKVLEITNEPTYGIKDDVHEEVVNDGSRAKTEANIF